MISSGTNPELTKKYEKKRNKIILKPDRYDSSDFQKYDISEELQKGIWNPEIYEIEQSPVDPETIPEKYDIRKRPECGD